MADLPPLPPGFKLDDRSDDIPPLPPGFSLDGEQPQPQQKQPRFVLKPEDKTWSEEIKHQLGRTGRIVVEGLTALPNIAADAGIAARNLITGENYQGASQMQAEALDAAGLPRARDGLEKGIDLAGQVVVGSKIPVPAARTRAPANFAPPASQAQQVIAEGQKHGVPVFFDDVTNSNVARKVGTAAESLPGPFGTGAGREVQAKAAQTAASRVVNQYAPTASDDVPVLVQKGLKTRLNHFRTAAGKLYSQAAQKLDPLGNVPRQQFDQVIAKEAGKQQQLGTLASDDVMQLLEKYRQAPQGNFTLMRELRSQLGDEISDFYTGKNAAIGQRGVTALKSMQEALEADMQAFAKQSGNDGFKAWKAADGFYKANIVPFKEAGFRDLVKTAEPEKAWRYLISQGSLPSRATRMYNSLDDAGRGAVRYGLVKDAMDSATNPNGSFSPAKFAKYLENHEAAVNTFFKGRDLQEIRGFQNLMRHVERAGQFAENPPTGNRLIPYLLGGAAVVEPSAAATIGASGLTVRTLFQTTQGRNLLLAMGRSQPGSTQAQAISRRIGQFLAQSSAVVGSASVKSDPAEATRE